MISAAEAKKVSDDYNNGAFAREIDYLDGEIRKAAEIGNIMIKKNSVSQLAREFLKDNGYIVTEMFDCKNDSCVVIEW